MRSVTFYFQNVTCFPATLTLTDSSRKCQRVQHSGQIRHKHHLYLLGEKGGAIYVGHALIRTLRYAARGAIWNKEGKKREGILRV